MALDMDKGIDTGADRYQFYLPRLVLHWEEDGPDATHRQIDGTMVFADISGFTAMSERLARFGKLGAEEVTDVLGECFKGLLAVAYSLGGRLIKFGGDALLILFDGAHHERRAVNAAVGMQETMARIGKVKTSAGMVSLQMSIGVHSGPFNFFMVGKSHRELVLTGPAVTQTVRMEAVAEAGEIVVSPATAGAVPGSAIGATKGPGFVVSQGLAGSDELSVDVRPAPAHLEQYIPLALRDALKVGTNEPEHRQVTVAFIQFSGVDSLMTAQGPDAVWSALTELVGTVQTAVDPRRIAFLATDVYEDGGKIILSAGAPTATGNDSERMLLALNEIIAAQPALSIQIGVNRGHVFSGDVGPGYRKTYTIMGDDVNLAARLMSSAGSHQIYATPIVLENSRTLFATTPLEPLSVKGKTEPVQAYAVGEESGTRSISTREELPFRGRREEMALLSEALEEVMVGSGGVVAVVGDRGLGKTRLIKEVAALEPELPILTIRAEPYGTASPYRPFRDPIRKALGIERGEQRTMARAMARSVRQLDPDLVPYLPMIGDVANVEVDSTPEVDAIDPQFRRDRVADVITRLFEIVHPGPLLMILEEGHLMDEASTELSAKLSRSTADHPWLVLTTRIAPDGGFEPEDSLVLELEPLDPGHAASVVKAATRDHPLRPHDIETIVHRSGGNPLFLEELLAVVSEKGSVADLPDSLDALVSAQIDALPPHPKRLLRYASVLGRSFRLSVLDEILSDEVLTMDQAARDALTGFLSSEGPDRMRFRHGLLHDVAYEGLSYRRRRELHSKAAHAIETLAGDETRSVADLLALHYSLARDYGPTWKYARVAGDEARDAYANIDAATQYERALEAAARLRGVPSGERAEVWEALGDVREQAGFYQASLDAFKRASRLVGEDLVARSELMLKRALARMRSGEHSQALSETARGLSLVKDLAGEAGERARARLVAYRAVLRAAQQRPRETLKTALEAFAMAEAVGEEESLARVYTVLDWAYLVLGQPQQAVYGLKALEIYQRLGKIDEAAHIMNNLGGMAYYDGRWDDAVDFYEKSQGAFRKAGNDAGAAFVGANIGEVLVSQNRLAEAEKVLQDAVRVLRATSAEDDAPFAEIQLARLLVECGEHAQAADLLRRLNTEASRLGQTVNELETGIYMARLSVLGGDPSDALDLLDKAEREAGGDAVVFAAALARERATALAAAGRVSEARRVVTAGLEEARRQGLPYDEALLLRLDIDLARDEGYEPDADRIGDAAALMERLGIRP